jgi:uncharacterized protein with PIN domain
MRLLCDEMLSSLARWLRAAGYDTALAEPGTPDTDLIRQCHAEKRVLVSRDRQLIRAVGADVGAVLLIDDDVDGQARMLAETLDLDWTRAPFTRCLIDNTPLRAADEHELARIPDRSRDLPGPFRACPQCGRLFWPGSHVRRMADRLDRWHSLALFSRTSAGPPETDARGDGCT